MRLYLIRHAQSENNALQDDPNHPQRKPDPSLTDIGFQQAEILAQHLANGHDNPNLDGYPITHLYCSAMHRTLLTTQPIANAINLQPKIWIEIHEKGGLFLHHTNGKQEGFPGLTRADIQAQFPDYHIPETITENGWWNPERSIEHQYESMQRAIKVALALHERRSTADHIALVTHGGFLDLLLKAIFNQLPANPHVFGYVHFNTAITRVDYYKDQPVLVYQNRITHLPPELWT